MKKIINVNEKNKEYVESFLNKFYGGIKGISGSKEIVITYPGIQLVKEYGINNHEEHWDIIKNNKESNQVNYKLILNKDLEDKLKKEIEYLATNDKAHLSDISKKVKELKNQGIKGV